MKTTITCKVKLFSLGILLATAAPVFVSCGGEDPIPELSVNLTAISVETAGEIHAITVTCNVEWAATANAEWIALSPASGTGNGTITVNVEANSTPETREATITIKAGALTETVTIKQPGIVPVIEISENSISAGAPANSYPLAVTSNIEWTADPDAEWITLDPTSGTGDGTITINVEANTSQSPRTGRVTVTAGTLSRSVDIYQVAVGLM
jgi:hypothetical protein